MVGFAVLADRRGKIKEKKKYEKKDKYFGLAREVKKNYGT